MKVTLELTGNIPSKKNSRINTKSGRSFPSPAYREWHKLASNQLMVQLCQSEEIRHGVEFPIEKCDNITVTFYYGTLRVKDNTNAVESVHDLLVDYGILKDDNWKVTGETRQIPIYRKGEPGAKIEIIITDKSQDTHLQLGS